MEIIAGPCSFESYKQTKDTVKFLTELGIKYIRGGALKYRSMPKDYQGTPAVYRWIADLKKEYYFEFVNEMYDSESDYRQDVDMIQVGSRNQMNTHLLKGLNGIDKPILLKRHYASSISSFLDHASYLDESEVILCLRGIMGLWPQEQRFMPDVTDIARLRELMHQRGLFNKRVDVLKVKDIKLKHKICYDVSHSACDSKYVKNLIKCAKVYEPDYLMIEVHNRPKKALSDAQQQINFATFESWVNEGLFETNKKE